MHFHPRWNGSLYLTTTAEQSRMSGAASRSATPLARVPAGADRLDRIRARVRDGSYASPAAMEALASCLLASGAR